MRGLFGFICVYKFKHACWRPFRVLLLLKILVMSLYLLTILSPECNREPWTVRGQQTFAERPYIVKTILVARMKRHHPLFFTSSKEIDTKTTSFKGVYKQKKVLQDFAGTPAWKENVTEEPESFLLLSPSLSFLSVCAPPSCSPSLPLKPSSM